jgi:hypothetical protein
VIAHGSFRFGNTKFNLTDSGKVQIDNVVTGPATGSSDLDIAVVTLDA